MPALVFFKRQSFQRAPREIAAGCIQRTGEIVRNFNCQIHK